MKQAPHLVFASDSTSGDFLAARVIQAYQNISPENLEEISTLYTSDVYFEDPTSGVQGKAALMAHFAKTFQKLEGCSFQFHRTVSDGADLFLAWTMTANYPKLQRGKAIRVEGSTYLKTRNGKIYFHRDYFDMGSLLYEHLPLLGRIILKIKHRLAL